MPNGWISTTIGKIADINPESLGVNTPEDFQFGYIDLSMVDAGAVTYPDSQITFASASPRARRVVRDGDILMSTVRPNLKGFGRIECTSEPLVCSTGFAVLRFSNDATARYVYQFLFSEFLDKQINSLVVGSNYPAINSDDVRGLQIAIPQSMPERAKIADVLRTWDEAVEKVSRLIGRRERQYIGLRSELIDWVSDEQAALKTFLKPVSRPVPKPIEKYRALGIRSHGKGTFTRVVENPDSVDMDTLYVAKAGDIIVNITFAWEGAVALVPPDHDGCLVSHRFPTYLPISDKADARYLRHVLRMPRFTYLLGLVSPGGAGRNRVLSKTALLDLNVPLPNLAEQARIATILDDAENAIAAESRLRDSLNRQKRGLMQKLLTGEWRVKVDGAKEAAA